MGKKNNYFSIGSKLFWGLILLVTVFSLLKLNPGIFKGENTAREIIVEDSLSKVNWDDNLVQIDSSEIKEDSLKKQMNLETSTWNWVDFNGKRHNIIFSFPIKSLEKATQNRKNNNEYGPLFENDKFLLKDLIQKMKLEIKRDNLNYLGAIEYVCSSIQYIPYTLVLTSTGIEYPPNSGNYVKCPCQTSFGFFYDNCSYKTPNGCCNDVDPFGVYSPFEFAYKKTGDCDTRALLAFTLLKEMGFDVAVMVSRKQWHSVLGVTLPNSTGLSTGRNLSGKKYVLWELTSPDWRLNQPVEGNDWLAHLE